MRQSGKSDVSLELWLLYDGPLLKKLQNQSDFTLICVPGDTRLKKACWIRKEVRRRSVDVLHAHGLLPEVFAALAIGVSGRPIFVSTVHSAPGNTMLNAPGRPASLSFLLWSVRRFLVGRIIAVTADIETTLTKSGIQSPKIQVIANSVEVVSRSDSSARAKYRARCEIPEEACVVGIVGRLDPIKGHDRLLRAAEELHRRKLPFVFWIIGDGPLRNDLELSCIDRGIESIVRFWGYRTDVRELMTALDVGVFCSDHEGMPFAALEFQAEGVPLVARNVGGLSELINEETGILYSSDDDDALLACLEWVLVNREEAQTLASRARDLLSQERSVHRFYQRTAELWFGSAD